MPYSLRLVFDFNWRLVAGRLVAGRLVAGRLVAGRLVAGRLVAGWRASIAVALAGSLLACVPIVNKRGTVFNPTMVRQLEVGTTTKAEATELFGRPSSVSMGGIEKWYFISSTFISRAWLKPRETERRVLVLDFDRNDTLTDVDLFGMADGYVVSFMKKTTPTRGKDLNALQQILSNVGRFNQQGGGP